MKMLFAMMMLLPVFSFAASSDDPTGGYGTEVSDSDLAKVHGSASLLCKQESQFPCYGRKAYTVCVNNPFTGQAGVCTPQTNPDEDGVVTCGCM